MPQGLNRNGDFRNGSPVTTPIDFGTDITLPHDFGNDVILPKNFGIVVIWLPNPAHFGNVIAPPISAPTLSGISVSQGPAAGGTSFTLTGTGFLAGATVTFGTGVATSVVVVSSTSITGVTPAGTQDTTVNITVTNVDAQFAVLTSGWMYQAVILSGALVNWTFEEQAGSFTSNLASPSTSNNALYIGERVFQISGLWSVTSGSVTITDGFAAGPNNSNQTATRFQIGGATGAWSCAAVVPNMSLPAGHVTISAWAKMNTGTTATLTPQAVGPGTTTGWTVTTSWQRFTFTVANGVAVTGVQFFLSANADILLYGVQMESGSSASAYVAPTFNLSLGSKGTGVTDVPTWSGNGTITSTKAQRTVGLNDIDTTLTMGTFYVALKSSTVTPQQYGIAINCPTATGTGVPERFELQTSFYNAPANSPTPAGGSRAFDAFLDEGASGGLTKEFPAGNLYDQRWHICCATYDGTDLHLYIDGILVDSPSSAPVSGTPTAFPFDVFGLGYQSPNSSLNFPGSYAFVAAYANTIHTYAQIKQNTDAISAKMFNDGILTGIIGTQKGMLAFEGDSITDGIGTGNVGHPALSGSNYGITWVNYGHSGDQIAQLNARATQLDALVDTTKIYNILVVLIGRNDLDHVTGPTFEASLAAYWAARKAAGWTVVACTLLPTTDVTAGPLIPAVNTWIRGNYSTACAALADFGGDATILANFASTTYLYDGTHPTALTYTIMTPYVLGAIASLSAKPPQPSNPAPTISSLSVSTGSHLGGTTVTLTGTGFLPGVKVFFGPNLAIVTNTVGVANVTPTSIVCTTPAGIIGTVNVTAENLDNQSGVDPSSFTYS